MDMFGNDKIDFTLDRNTIMTGQPTLPQRTPLKNKGLRNNKPLIRPYFWVEHTEGDRLTMTTLI